VRGMRDDDAEGSTQAAVAPSGHGQAGTAAADADTPAPAGHRVGHLRVVK